MRYYIIFIRNIYEHKIVYDWWFWLLLYTIKCCGKYINKKRIIINLLNEHNLNDVQIKEHKKY